MYVWSQPMHGWPLKPRPCPLLALQSPSPSSFPLLPYTHAYIHTYIHEYICGCESFVSAWTFYIFLFSCTSSLLSSLPINFFNQYSYYYINILLASQYNVLLLYASTVHTTASLHTHTYICGIKSSNLIFKINM